MTSQPANIAIVGAGPIGLEAALLARQRGHGVTVYERGRIGENVRDWGHVRLFTPFAMNSTPRGRRALRESGVALPADDALLTGGEYVAGYLEPLARLSEIADCVLEQTNVLSISRSWISKGDQPGSPDRAADRFEILCEHGGRESLHQFDVVIDCSGTYSRHSPMGGGGKPCPGERSVLSDDHYRLQDITGAQRDVYLRRRTLVVGSGFSAATAVGALGQLAQESADTECVWITRKRDGAPMRRDPADRLPERDRVAAAANECVANGVVGWRPDTRVTAIERAGAEKFIVVFEERGGHVTHETFDNILVHTGLKPDTRLFEELQVHQCYATDGPIRLAAALLGSGSSDCLDQPEVCGDTLSNPEPNFFVLGSKSYGRSSHFLLEAGLKQIEQVFGLIPREIEVCR